MIILKTIGQRIKYARENIKLEPADVAKLIPMSLQGYLDLETGKSAFPRQYARISEILQVSASWLLTGEGYFPYSETGEFIVPDGFAPLLNWNEAIQGVNKNTLKDKRIIIPMRSKASIKAYALQIEDNSMTSTSIGEQTFLPGDYILIDPEENPCDKDFVLAVQKGGNKPVFKQYLIDGNKIVLSSLNPRYQSVPLNEDIEIIGVVVEKYTPLKARA